MHPSEADIPAEMKSILAEEGISEFRPCQEKAILKGLFRGKNLLVCTPTASGKTLVAEMAVMDAILHNKGKTVYIVPLKALATEKYKDFKRKYEKYARIALSIGDMDSSDKHLSRADLIICTSEKLDSLIRHRTPWISDLAVVVVDEVHLINDPGRGPTLEILITMLRRLIPKMQLVCLSATIGNEKDLAGWLDAELVHDTWRPVELKKGIYYDGEIEFY
ncbi:MAG: DEAD/DEAH box helicase [Candidatus Nanoarchaeia archaeon]